MLALFKTVLSVLSVALLMLAAPSGRAGTTTLLALGDSLTAGLGLDPQDAFPAKLEAALRARGHDVTIINAGVSGDIAAQGAARLDWSLTDEVDGVILELGANDALRGLEPKQTEAALGEILGKLQARKLPVLLAGMRAPPNLGPDYGSAFDAVFPRLAEAYGAVFYPFYLDGVAAVPELNQADGMHPSAAGVDVIVQRITPAAEELLARITPP